MPNTPKVTIDKLILGKVMEFKVMAFPFQLDTLKCNDGQERQAVHKHKTTINSNVLKSDLCPFLLNSAVVSACLYVKVTAC